MIPRRQLLGSSVLGGMFGMLGVTEPEAEPAAAAQQLSDRALDTIVQAIDALRNELRNERSFTEIQTIRNMQKSYLNLNGKLPDFLDVGTDVWFNIYDWHIRWQQAMTLGRDGLGRHTILLFQTLIILRTDVQPTYVGIPSDNR